MSNQLSSSVLKEVNITVLRDGSEAYTAKLPENTLDRFFKSKFKNILSWYCMTYDSDNYSLAISFKMNNQIQFILSTETDVPSVTIKSAWTDKKVISETQLKYVDLTRGYVAIMQDIYSKLLGCAIHGWRQIVNLNLNISKCIKEDEMDMLNKLRSIISSFPNYSYSCTGPVHIDYKNLSKNLREIFNSSIYVVEEYHKSSPKDSKLFYETMNDNELIEDATESIIIKSIPIPILIKNGNRNNRKKAITEWRIDLTVLEKYYSSLKSIIDSISMQNDALYFETNISIGTIDSGSDVVKVSLYFEYYGYSCIPDKLLEYLGKKELTPSTSEYEYVDVGNNSCNHVNYSINGNCVLYY